MIIGIGHDLTSIARVEQILNGKACDRFLQRIFSPLEMEHTAKISENRLAEYVAGRFAAKEAVSKAFGCGIGHQLGFHDIKILKLRTGQPVCELSQAGLERLGLNERDIAVHLTITHESNLASAYVIVERLNGN